MDSTHVDARQISRFESCLDCLKILMGPKKRRGDLAAAHTLFILVTVPQAVLAPITKCRMSEMTAKISSR